MRTSLQGITAALAVGLAVLHMHPSAAAGSAGATDSGAWALAVNLGSVVNSPFDDLSPHLSKDERSLFFASARPGFGGDDIWVSQRDTADSPWAVPVNLGGVINTAADERTPSLSRDGRYLFFVSNRPGGSGLFDIWVTWRHNKKDDFGWERPVNLATLNTPANDVGPSFFENDVAGVPQLFFASNRVPFGFDIYVSAVTGESFQAPTAVAALNTAAVELTPHILKSGLEIFIASNRNGTSGLQDLWVSQRATLNDEWMAPVNLGPALNTAFQDWFPTLTSSGLGLYFASDRPGGLGDNDLYSSTRAK